MKSGQILCIKRISMLTSVKKLSLACKCVFCTTKRNAKGGLNFEGLEMQKQNISTDRA